MKRKGRNPDDMEDLGPSRSQLRALESAERIQRQLAPIQWDIERVSDAQRSVGFDASQVDAIAGAQEDTVILDPDEAGVDLKEASISLDEARISIEDVRVNLSDFRPHRAHEQREDGKRSPASSHAVIEHLTKAWKGLGRCPRHFIFQMRYPHSSETCCTYANSRRTTCLHGSSVRLTPNPLCWLGILFRSRSKWAFNGFSAIESGFASKQVFDGRSY